MQGAYKNSKGFSKILVFSAWEKMCIRDRYRAAMYAAVKSANPNWKPGQKFDTSILDNVKRESVESTPVSYTHLDVYKRQGSGHLVKIWSLCA